MEIMNKVETCGILMKDKLVKEKNYSTKIVTSTLHEHGRGSSAHLCREGKCNKEKKRVASSNINDSLE